MVDARAGTASGQTVRLPLWPPGSVRGKVTVSVRQRRCSRSCRGGIAADDQAANGPETCSRTGTITLGSWSAEPPFKQPRARADDGKRAVGDFQPSVYNIPEPTPDILVPLCSGRAVESGEGKSAFLPSHGLLRGLAPLRQAEAQPCLSCAPWL